MLLLAQILWCHQVLKLKPFEKVENKAVGLPEGITVNIPDVSEELEQLFAVKKE